MIVNSKRLWILHWQENGETWVKSWWVVWGEICGTLGVFPRFQLAPPWQDWEVHNVGGKMVYGIRSKLQTSTAFQFSHPSLLPTTKLHQNLQEETGSHILRKLYRLRLTNVLISFFHLHLHEKLPSPRQNYMFKYTDAAHKASHGCSTET